MELIKDYHPDDVHIDNAGFIRATKDAWTRVLTEEKRLEITDYNRVARYRLRVMREETAYSVNALIFEEKCVRVEPDTWALLDKNMKERIKRHNESIIKAKQAADNYAADESARVLLKNKRGVIKICPDVWTLVSEEVREEIRMHNRDARAMH